MNSRDVAHLYHWRQLCWDWRARNPDKRSYIWPGLQYFYPGGLCFACCFDFYLVEPEKTYTYECIHNLYLRWVYAAVEKEKRAYALKIRDLDLSDFAKQLLLKED